MNLIDTHAHIYYDDYSDSIDTIIQDATSAGIEKIICVGVDLRTSEQCVKLAEQYSIVYATCGYHPHEASKTPKRYLYELEQFYTHPKVIAVGEIGLDYHYNFSEPKKQKKVYQEQLEMANSLALPAIVHCRNSDDDILDGIKNSASTLGVIHCFASTIDFAKKILDTGFIISFTGLITFVEELEQVVKEVPIEKIMLETDSPYLSPIPHRGKKNQPAYIIHIAKKIAELKNIDIEKVASITTETAYKIFSKLSLNI
tara:strand:+ start:2995 stop:3765 length:771 start_codon:yes stop_codon:yes gene_type:complete